jgi:hypothetical protein
MGQSGTCSPTLCANGSMVGTAQIRLCPPFCNGPGLVNPFFVVRSPGSCFCTGSARGRHLMGLEEDKAGQSTGAWSHCHWMGNGLT